MINPTAVKNLFGIEGLDIAWYGIIIASGIVLGVILAILYAKKIGYKSDLVIDFMILALPLSIICARLYYVGFDYFDRPENYKSFYDVIAIWDGGIAIYGAVIGGVLAAFIITGIKKFPFPRLLDICAPSLALGQAIGRWGNFCNQEAFGRAVTDPNLQFFPYSVYIERNHSVFDDAAAKWVTCTEPWHQATFFYESMWDLAVFFFLIWYRKRAKYDGNVMAMYFIAYGLGRFIIEGMRTDSLWAIPGVIRISQFLSLIFIAGGLAYILVRRKLKKENAIYNGDYLINKN